MTRSGGRARRAGGRVGTAGLLMLAVLACGPRKPDQGGSIPPAATDVPRETVVDEGEEGQASTTALRYPKTARGDVVDEYHGSKVPDPYRWLEDLDSDQTRAWVEAQNEVTFEYLESIAEREA